MRVDLDIETERIDKGERRQQIDANKLKYYYESLVQPFYGCSMDRVPNCRPLGRDAWLRDFPDYKLSVAALNSCEKESHDDHEHYGSISAEQAGTLMSIWKEHLYQTWLKIIVVHHNPIPTTQSNIDNWIRSLFSKDRIAATQRQIDGTPQQESRQMEFEMLGFEGKELVQAVCADTTVQLVLHGHHHATGAPIGWPTPGGTTWVLSTGSWGLQQKHLPDGELPNCALVQLNFEVGPSIISDRLDFDLGYRPRGFVKGGHFRPKQSNQAPLNSVLPAGYHL